MKAIVLWAFVATIPLAFSVAARDLDTARRNWLGDRSDPKRTLTNLYNQRPTWLDLAHRRLDAAVCAAYDWPADLTDDQILDRLLALNLSCATAAGVHQPERIASKPATAGMCRETGPA